MGAAGPPSPYPTVANAEPPPCPRRRRRHLHRRQRGRAVDPGALQVCPLRPPPPAAPLRPPPVRLGMTAGLAPQVSLVSPRGVQGCWLFRAGMSRASTAWFGFHRTQDDNPSSVAAILPWLHLLACPGAWGPCPGADPNFSPPPSSTPSLKSIKKILLRQMGARGHLPLRAVPGFA